MRVPAVLGLALFAAGCIESSRELVVRAVPGAEPDRVAEEQRAALRSIASRYTSLTKVTVTPHVAPELCAAMPAQETALRSSRSGDQATHGRKVYYLFAANAEAYLEGAGQEGTVQPDDQVLVKEAWTPEETTYEAPGDKVLVEGKLLRPSTRSSLFVMARRDDGGWAFGLVAPDGTVTTEGAATRSCHGCHDAQPDGLFGLTP